MAATVLSTTAILAFIFLLASYYMQSLRPADSSAGKLDVRPFQPLDLCCSVILIAYFYLLIFHQSGGTTPGEIKLSSLILNQVILLFPPLALFFFRLNTAPLRNIPGWKRHNSLNNLLVAPFLALLAIIVFNSVFHYSGVQDCIADFFKVNNTQSTVLLLRNGPADIKAAIAVSAIIIAPLIEELMFRGYLYPVLKKYCGMLPSLVFTSILFGLIHKDIVAAIPLTVFSVLLILIYEKTRTLWAPIIAHAGLNASTVFATIFIPMP